jgi:hypothetical protein
MNDEELENSKDNEKLSSDSLLNLAAPAHSLISTAQNKNLIENKFKSKILILSLSGRTTQLKFINFKYKVVLVPYNDTTKLI